VRRQSLFLMVLVVFANCAVAQTGREAKGSQPRLRESSGYDKLPLSFAANVGQSDSRVKFLAGGRALSLFLTADEAVVILKKPSTVNAIRQAGASRTPPNRSDRLSGDTIRMRLVGADATSQVVGTDELPGKANYFLGNDPSKWRTNVSTYSKVKYEGVYPGIDLVYYGNQGQLEYDFVVSAGTDPSSIGVRFNGTDKLKIDGNGDLLLSAEGLRFQKPLMYQESAGVKKEIEGRYELAADNTVHFAVGDYDHSQPLVIDPALVYSTYLGGSLVDNVSAIAVDASQNVYVIGSTNSTDFPTVNAFQPIFPSVQTPEADAISAFITKINASGSALVFSTFLGGSGPDLGLGIAVDSAGSVYATGRAASDNFPTLNPIQASRSSCCGPGAGSAAFVTKLSPSGSALVYSTYLGGFGEDFGSAIAVDATGNAYITGFANSPLLDDCPSCSFPTTPNVVQPNLGGTPDVAWNAFVSKINPAGSALVFSTYLGGSSHDIGNSIAVDPDGNVYVTGNALSTDFPTANAIQPHLKATNPEQTGNTNAFVTKLNPTGTAFIYSTYLGGTTSDSGGGIAADSSGNAYITGGTSSADFPTAHPLQSTLKGSSNAFLTKINPGGSAFVYSTFLGGTGGDGAGGVKVDQLGNVYIAGATSSTDFPTHDALQPTIGGSSDAFVAEINPSGNALVYSTYLGGSGSDSGGPIALDPLGNVYLAGNTSSVNFPTVNALQHAFAGGVEFEGGDVFVAKIGSTIAERFNLSGNETSIGHVCMVNGHVATCGAHFVGWSGGAGHVANGWVASPGDGKAVFEANVAYTGDVAFGKTVELVKGSTLQLLLKPNRLLSESVTEGTVTWPASVHDDLGCGGGVAKVHALFTSSNSGPGSFVGCLHDLPAGSVLPPKIWGTFFHIKGQD
jgi:hypothetical protein